MRPNVTGFHSVPHVSTGRITEKIHKKQNPAHICPKLFFPPTLVDLFGSSSFLSVLWRDICSLHTLMLWRSAFKEPLGPKRTRSAIRLTTRAYILTYSMTWNVSYRSWGALKCKHTCTRRSICKHRPLQVKESSEVWDDSSINQLL